jgi:hypothetical protein
MTALSTRSAERIRTAREVIQANVLSGVKTLQAEAALECASVVSKLHRFEMHAKRKMAR